MGIISMWGSLREWRKFIGGQSTGSSGSPHDLRPSKDSPQDKEKRRENLVYHESGGGP